MSLESTSSMSVTAGHAASKRWPMALAAAFGLSTLVMGAMLVNDRLHVWPGQDAVVTTSAIAAAETPAALQDIHNPVVQAPISAAVPQTGLPAAVLASSAARSGSVAKGVASLPCARCGTVQRVREVVHSAPASGAGAVAGGVLGGLLGHQLGGGLGKTAMTVLGAVGGGYAGNAVEHKLRQTRAYEITVRTQDGRLHVLQQSQALAVGTPVELQGLGLRVLNPAPAAPENIGG